MEAWNRPRSAAVHACLSSRDEERVLGVAGEKGLMSSIESMDVSALGYYLKREAELFDVEKKLEVVVTSLK